MKNLSLALLFLDGKPTENLEFLSVDFLNEKQVNVFETMRVENGTIFRLTEHLDRLYASMQTVGLSIAKNRESLKKEIYKALEQVSKKKICFLRITIIGPHPIILIFDRAYPESIYQQGIDLVTAAVKRNASNALPPEAKTNQFLNAILSYSKKGQVFTLRQKSRRDPSTKQSMRFLRQTSPALWRANLSPFEFETLFLDVNGYVKECRVSNIFLIKKDVLKTPPPVGILDGVTRRFVIECAHKLGTGVQEALLTRHDFWNADEAFLTNTSGGIIPIRSLDQRLIGQQIPGPITRELTKQFQIELAREIKNSRHASN